MEHWQYSVFYLAIKLLVFALVMGPSVGPPADFLLAEPLEEHKIPIPQS